MIWVQSFGIKVSVEIINFIVLLSFLYENKLVNVMTLNKVRENVSKFKCHPISSRILYLAHRRPNNYTDTNCFSCCCYYYYFIIHENESTQSLIR